MSLARKSFLSLVAACLVWLAASPTATGQQHEAQQSLKVEKVQTPLTEAQLMRVLKKSHASAFGSEPTAPRLAMAWAHVALENGRGKLTYNHNLGNVGAPLQSQEHYLVSGHKYRSFKTFAEAGEAYWRVVKKCSAAYEAMQWGDAGLVATYLKRCGYYAVDEEQYAASMRDLYYRAVTKVAPAERGMSDDDQ